MGGGGGRGNTQEVEGGSTLYLHGIQCRLVGKEDTGRLEHLGLHVHNPGGGGMRGPMTDGYDPVDALSQRKHRKDISLRWGLLPPDSGALALGTPV